MRVTPYGLSGMPALPRPTDGAGALGRDRATGSAVTPTATGASGEPTALGGLHETFEAMLERAVSTDQNASAAVDAYARGDSQDLPETMIALQKADISLSLIVNVRNKLVEAYREVMRMS
jgi:flagellar hook-basal body complex protein FliE